MRSLPTRGPVALGTNEVCGRSLWRALHARGGSAAVHPPHTHTPAGLPEQHEGGRRPGRRGEGVPASEASGDREDGGSEEAGRQGRTLVQRLRCENREPGQKLSQTGSWVGPFLRADVPDVSDCAWRHGVGCVECDWSGRRSSRGQAVNPPLELRGMSVDARDEERRRGPTAPTREGLDGRVGHAGPCVLWLALL